MEKSLRTTNRLSREEDSDIDTLGKVLINLFAACILMIMLINENQRTDRLLLHERLFLMLIYPNIVLCLSDAIAWSLEGVGGWFNIILNQVFTSTSYIAIPVLTFGWFLYAHYNTFRNEWLLERFQHAAIPILCLLAAVVVINPITHWLFYLDALNQYHRGILFFPYTFFTYMMLPITLIMIIANRKRIERTHFLPMLLFIFPMVFTSLLAILVYGIAIAWVGTTISIFIIYLFIQNQRIGTDYLTGIYNRRQLTDYLQGRMRGRRSNDCFGIAMIDINRFKHINDNWGHKVGDEVLVALARILTDTYQEQEFLARYAGDEFIIVMESSRLEDVHESVARLYRQIDQFNASSGKPWTLGVSVGYDLYDPDSGMSMDALLHHIDKLMYKSKITPGNAPVTESGFRPLEQFRA